MLRPGDALVFVSALAPARNNSMLIDNLHGGNNMRRVAAGQLAQLAISSDAVYADDANPVTERSCQQPSSLHGVMHLAREVMLRTALSCRSPSYGQR
jgi:hypothetical protein